MFKRSIIIFCLLFVSEGILLSQSNPERLRESKNPFGRKREKSKTSGSVFKKRGRTKQFGDISSFVNHRTRVASNFWSRLAFWKYSNKNKAKPTNYSYGKVRRSEMRGLFKRQRTSGKWFKERTLRKLNKKRNSYRRRNGY
jgi:hypothetical protein